MPLLNKPQTDWDEYMIRQARPRRWWRSRRFWIGAAIAAASVLVVILSARYLAV